MRTITQHFNSRTVANMEVALERTSRLLKKKSEQLAYRRYIASNILRRAKGGDTTLEGLTEAGSAAARDLRVRAKPTRQLRKKSDSVIRARHLLQRGRSIEESGTSGISRMIPLSCIVRRLLDRACSSQHQQRVPKQRRTRARNLLLDGLPNGFQRLSDTRHSGIISLLCPVGDVPSRNYRVSRQGTDS